MKKLILLITVIAFWGCDKASTAPTDCAGVVGGTAVVDGCGVCDSDATNDGVELWGWCLNIEETTSLDLHASQLTGGIPPEIGNLTSLTSLDFGMGNQLTGEIPPEIGQLTNLTFLNLYNNQLTGEIPVEICNQSDILLSLSYNKLCPPYPSCIDGIVEPQDTSECEYCIANPDDHPYCN